MTLKLGIRIELEKGNVAAGAREAAREIDGIGASAEAASKGARVLGTSLEEMAAKVDPLAAATLRYKRELAELRAAHEATAISGETLVRREVELKASFERTMSASVARAGAMKRAAESIVGGLTVTPDRAGDIAAYGAGLDQLQARFDPLFAAQQRYAVGLAEVRRAHAVGAVDARVLADREAEFRAELERTTAALIANSSSMSRYLTARNGGRDMRADVLVARQTITPDRAADIAAYGAELDARQAQFDPLFAAQQRYLASLAEVREAHAVGAVDAKVLADREAEFRAELERTTAALIANSSSMSRYLTARNGGRDMRADVLVARQTITPDRAADIAAYGAEMDALRAKFVPLFGAEKAHKELIEAIGHAQRVGAIDAEEATAAVAHAKLVHEAHIATLQAADGKLRTHAGSMRLNGLAAQQLSYQLNDVVVSLASGMNPLTVLIQQGSQITPIFGGIGATLRVIGGLFTPMVAGAATLAAGVGLVAKATWDYNEAIRASSVAAAGLGRNVGTTSGQIERIATTYASAGEVSIASAREMAQEFTRTGKIGVANFAGLIAIAKDFATTLGTDVQTGTQKLAEIMADPAKGAVTLSESLGLIDSATQRAVQRLVDQNRVYEAQAALIAALKPNLVAAAEGTNAIARAWESAKRAVSDYYTALGRAMSVDVITKADDLEQAQLKLRKAEDRARAMTPGSWTRLDAERDLVPMRAEVARLEAQAAAAKERNEAYRKDAAGKLGVATADASSSPMVQDMVRRKALAQELQRLEESKTATNLTGEEQTRIAAAISAKTNAQRTWISELERSRQIQEIDLAVMQSRDPVERAQLEHKRALIQLAGQEVTAAEATTIAEQAYARVLGEVSAQARGNIADITADAAARTRVNALVAAGAISLADANRELQIEAATRQLSIQLASAEGAERTRLLDLIRQTRTAIAAQDQAQRIASAQQSLASGNDRLETLRTEIALIGQSEAVRTRTLALLEAEQRIRREGLGGTAIADQIRAQAAATAELTTALERQKAAWGEIETTGSSAIDTITEGLRTGKDISKQLTDDITKELMKLTVANPLKNWLFGKNLPEIGDVSKTLFGGRGSATPASILPQAVGTATITAGTVVVNGGVAGAGIGNFAPASNTNATGSVPLAAANDNGANGRVAGAWSQFPSADDRVAGAWKQFSEPTGPGPFAGPTPSWWRPDLAPSSARVGGTWDRWPNFGGGPIASRATGYSPQLGGDRIEGGYESSIRGPDGQAMVRTLDDYRLGRSDYVTLAGDPRFYGNRYSMPEVSYLSGGQRYSLQNVPGVVHDTGSAFRGAPEGRFDVALGRDLSFAERNQSMAGTQFIAQSSANASKAIEKLATSSEGASNQVLDLGKGLQSITGSGMGSGGSIAGASAEGSGGGLLGGLGGLLQSLFKSLFGGFGSIFSGLFGGFFADGSAFSAGSVVATPASIGMSGGRRGIIGEAGPEAVLPLTRGADGKLGVVAAIRTTAAAQPMAISASELKRIAGGGGAPQPAPTPRVDVPITINNHAKADVSVQSRVGAGGGREYDILVRDIQDRMEDRYGLTPQKRRR